MAQFLGLGDARNGLMPDSGVINSFSPCSASASGNTVTTGLSVSVGDQVMLHQTRGGSLQWEVVIVKSVGSGNFTVVGTISNSYSGSAQAVKIPQYNGGNPNGIITTNSWDGSTGGIAFAIVNGELKLNSGQFDVSSKGFRNDALTGGEAQGEGNAGPPNYSLSANSNGGGGGQNGPDGGHVEAGHGGGGANATPGGSPSARNTAQSGVGGSVVGSSDLTTISFGGAGAWGGREWNGGAGLPRQGGKGGGIVIIFARKLILTSANRVIANGQVGTDSNDRGGAGGGGAAGSILIKAIEVEITNSNGIVANPGNGGVCTGAFGGNGGNGGDGRIRIEACRITGGNLTSPTASLVEGGFNFCGSSTVVM